MSGVKWYTANAGWGLRGDYRFTTVRGKDDAPSFLGRDAAANSALTGASTSTDKNDGATVRLITGRHLSLYMTYIMYSVKSALQKERPSEFRREASGAAPAAHLDVGGTRFRPSYAGDLQLI